MSLDGRIALPNGSSKWISGKESRKKVHQFRSKCDAIIVGGGTVRADDPLLTSRGLFNKEPLRVVFTSSLKLPQQAQLWNIEKANTLIAYGPDSDLKLLEHLPKGPELLKMTSNDPSELLKALARKGCNKVLWECGGGSS